MGQVITVEGWESILARHIKLAKNAPPRQCGVNDCMMRVRSIVEDCCSVDILLGLRYKDEAHLAHLTKGNIEGFLTNHWKVFKSVEPRNMQRLDFGYYRNGEHHCVGVCVGTRVLVTLNAGGCVQVPKSKVLKAWRPVYE